MKIKIQVRDTYPPLAEKPVRFLRFKRKSSLHQRRTGSIKPEVYRHDLPFSKGGTSSPGRRLWYMFYLFICKVNTSIMRMVPYWEVVGLRRVHRTRRGKVGWVWRLLPPLSRGRNDRHRIRPGVYPM
jgi:hypothetical protein